MLSNKTIIYGQWKVISAAGEDGKAWINKYLGNVKVNVLIAHTDVAQTPSDDIPFASTTDIVIDAAYLLPLDSRISDGLFADNGNDIYYATIKQPNESVQLTVDFG